MHPVGKTIRWIEKWMTAFWWVRRDLSPCKVWRRSHHARRRKCGVYLTFYLVIWLFGVYFAPAKMWCLFNRQDCRVAANRRYCFTHRPKIRFITPQGRLVAQIQVKLCSTDGHLGPLGCAKFHVNRCRGLGMRPENIRNFHFLVKQRLAGSTPLTHFQNF